MAKVRMGVLAAALLAMASCVDGTREATAPVEVGAPVANVEGSTIWADTYEGGAGHGDQIGLYMPYNWNGDVVYYAHGFHDVAEPLALPYKENIAAIRDSLGAAGFAVAYSSYTENGYALPDATQRTHGLREKFRVRYGRARRSFAMGHSLGGLVALELAERFPGQYAGALPICGVVGGTEMQLKYIGDVRTLFDWFYPGAVPGSTLNMPADLNLFTQVIGPAQARVMADPSKAIAIASIDEVGFLQLGYTPTEAITGLLNAVGFHARGMQDVLARTHGESPFKNDTTTYSSSLPLVPGPVLGALNATVPRFNSTEFSVSWMMRNYEPTGLLRIPVLTLHTQKDPAVPVWHERRLAEKALATGSSGMLLQRTVNSFGHCNVTVPQTLDAFRTLVGWVSSGVKPAA